MRLSSSAFRYLDERGFRDGVASDRHAVLPREEDFGHDDDTCARLFAQRASHVGEGSRDEERDECGRREHAACDVGGSAWAAAKDEPHREEHRSRDRGELPRALGRESDDQAVEGRSSIDDVFGAARAPACHLGAHAIERGLGFAVARPQPQRLFEARRGATEIARNFGLRADTLKVREPAIVARVGMDEAAIRERLEPI
jgi:hypothetical protein